MDSIPSRLMMALGSEFELLPVNVGQPMYINSGLFSGQHIRVELQELQQADLGRKYAKVDRRPVDPPPAILLRIFAVYGLGTDRQREQEIANYQDIKNLGMICTLDLFPVPESALDNRQIHQPRPPPATANTDYQRDLQTQSLTFFPLHPYSTLEYPGTSHSPFHIPRRQSILSHLTSQPLHDVVFRLDNHLVTESSKLTPALVGEKFVEPVLMEYMGKKSLIFVFSDVAVQREGTFIFRYRVFDIFSSIRASVHQPILAEVFGGAFRVYSTREFPGLSPSTELTKSLSKFGPIFVSYDPTILHPVTTSKFVHVWILHNLTPSDWRSNINTFHAGMSQQTDTAVPTRLQSINHTMTGHKLRLAGRLLSYDIATALILLLDKDQAVLVDVSLCVDPSSGSWAREYLSILMIIGHLETSPIELPIPTMPAYAPAPTIDPQLVFRALRVIQASDLDLDLWHLAIEEKDNSDIT